MWRASESFVDLNWFLYLSFDICLTSCVNRQMLKAIKPGEERPRSTMLSWRPCTSRWGIETKHKLKKYHLTWLLDELGPFLSLHGISSFVQCPLTENEGLFCTLTQLNALFCKCKAKSANLVLTRWFSAQYGGEAGKLAILAFPCNQFGAQEPGSKIYNHFGAQEPGSKIN